MHFVKHVQTVHICMLTASTDQGFPEMGFVCIKVWGSAFADFISFFLNIPWKWNNLVSLRPNYFIYILKWGAERGGGGSSEPPLDRPLNCSILDAGIFWSLAPIFINNFHLRYNFAKIYYKKVIYQKVSMIKKYHNHILQINPPHCEEGPQNSFNNTKQPAFSSSSRWLQN